MMRIFLFAAMLLGAISAASAESVFTTRLEDPRAVYLSAREFGAQDDGKADDSGPIQAAIDKAESAAREGIVFVPSGRYRLTRTIFIWPGVRVFGYGATRPVFYLADRTPGFQSGVGDMVIFTGLPREGPRAGGRIAFPPPGTVPPNDSVADANPNTFYSAMSNIDFEIGDGNPAAIAIRFHVAKEAGELISIQYVFEKDCWPAERGDFDDNTANDILRRQAHDDADGGRSTRGPRVDPRPSAPGMVRHRAMID